MVRFIDCNCMIGPAGVPQPATFTSVGELLAEMNYCDIEGGLVYHTDSREIAPAPGNQRLLGELAALGAAAGPRLRPCWVVLPHHSGELPAPDELIAQMRAERVPAARIFPAAQRWSLSDWSAGPLLEALAAAHVPLFVTADQVSWDDIYRIGRNHRGLPIVVNEVRYEAWRVLFPLLEALPNLHIDLCWMVTHGWLEHAVQRFGPERFLFGTRLPLFTAGPAITQVMFADITEHERELIAGGNLERLLAWQELVQ